MNSKYEKFPDHKNSAVFIAVFTASEQPCDAIIGRWENPDSTRQIDIYKKDNLYFGKIFWVKDASKVKPGEIVLQNIECVSGQWNGQIKIPGHDTIGMTITMNGRQKISIGASYGLLSKTKIWTRIAPK